MAVKEVGKVNLLRLFFFIGISLIFVAIGVNLVSSNILSSHIDVWNDVLLKTFVGFINILFFGFSAVIFILILIKALRKENVIKIDNEGITNNSTLFNSYGLIKWENIMKIAYKKSFFSTYILITINNPQEFISRKHNFITKQIIKSNFKNSGSDIKMVLYPLLTKSSADNILEQIQQEWEKQKKI